MGSLREEIPRVNKCIPMGRGYITPPNFGGTIVEHNDKFRFFRRAKNAICSSQWLWPLHHDGFVEPFNWLLWPACGNRDCRFLPGDELDDGKLRLVRGE